MSDDIDKYLSKIEHSILATPEEVSEARQLHSEAEAGSVASQAKLRALSTRVSDRERGSSSGQLVVPSASEVATPMIAGLENFAGGMEPQLAEQVETSRRSRRLWLFATVSFTGLAALSAIVGAMSMVGGLSIERTVPFLFFAAILLGCSVVPFRVYQSADVDYRRAREKQVALKFFVSSIRLTSEGGPAASALSPVLNGALSMFMTHYESTQAPLSIRDMLPDALPGLKA